MSKYDEPNFKPNSETKASFLSIVTDQMQDKEVLSLLDGIPISSIKEMVYLSPIESSYYTHMNNNQQKITKDYLTKCNLFSKCNSKEDQILFFIDIIKKHYGSIINSTILKQFIESISMDNLPKLSLRDYERLLMLNCCKDNINLNNENDCKLFTDLISNLING